METVLYAIRHGKTLSNELGHKMGQLDSPLMGDGINHAKQMIPAFGYDADHPQIIFSSDLARAYNTANTIREELGLEPGQLSMSWFLREANLGDFGGYSSDELHRVDPQYKTNMDRVLPNGESFSFMQQRVVYFVSQLLTRPAETRILVVTHAGPIRALLAEYGKKELRVLYEKTVSHDPYRFTFRGPGQDCTIDFYHESSWEGWSLDGMKEASWVESTRKRERVSEKFAAIKRQVDAVPVASAREDAQYALERLIDEACQGDQADKGRKQRWATFLRETLSSSWGAAVDTLF